MIKKGHKSVRGSRRMTVSSESGYSESSFSTSMADHESHSPIAAPTLQSYLQTWTPEETPEMASLVTIVINGVEINGYFKNDEFAKLKMAMEGIGGTGTTLCTNMPSMPPVDESEISDLCHNWIQQHHIQTPALEDSAGTSASNGFGNGDLGTSPKTDKIETMADKLKPKLPCAAREKSHVPQSSLDSDESDSFRQAALNFSSPGTIVPPKKMSSDEEEEEEHSPVHVLSKWTLEEDLRVSSDEEDDKSALQPPPQAPMTEVCSLEGTKLRINLRKINWRAMSPVPPKKRRTRSWSCSSTSESMEDEDLPLFDDDFDSKPEDSSSSENEEDLLCSVPKREPRPVEQEALVAQERKYTLEYNVWLEMRRQQYAKYIPDEAGKMLTNMQPVVRLERNPDIDRMARGIEEPKNQAENEDENSLRVLLESMDFDYDCDGKVMDMPNLAAAPTTDGDAIMLDAVDIQEEEELSKIIAGVDAVQNVAAVQEMPVDCQSFTTDSSPVVACQSLLNDSDIPEPEIEIAPEPDQQLHDLEAQTEEFQTQMRPDEGSTEEFQTQMRPDEGSTEEEIPPQNQPLEELAGSDGEGVEDQDYICLDVSDEEYL